MRILIVLLIQVICSTAALAGPCDFVLRWDQDSISDCMRHTRSEIDSLKLQVQTLQLENRVLSGHMCLLAGDVQRRVPGADVALIIADACADVRARASAKEKAIKSKKP
jgi:hypothetical protein